MPSTDLISLFVVPLNNAGLTYMVTGAVASTVYGEPRFTRDIDLVVALSDSDVPRLISAFSGIPDLYIPGAETIQHEAARSEGGHFNLIHAPSSLKADVYASGRDPLHAWALDRRRSVSVGGTPVFLAPPEYVIVRKLEFIRDGGGDRHGRDIRAMLSTLGDEFDRPELDAHVRERGLADVLHGVLGTSGP